MEVVTTRHPRRTTETPVHCSTHPPTGRVGRRALPGPPEPDLCSSPTPILQSVGVHER